MGPVDVGGRGVVLLPGLLAARGESPASHRGRRGAPMTRRDDRAYREYVREEQRSQRGCIAGRMQLDFHSGLAYRGGRGGSNPEGTGIFLLSFAADEIRAALSSRVADTDESQRAPGQNS